MVAQGTHAKRHSERRTYRASVYTHLRKIIIIINDTLSSYFECHIAKAYSTLNQTPHASFLMVFVCEQ